MHYAAASTAVEGNPVLSGFFKDEIAAVEAQEQTFQSRVATISDMLPLAVAAPAPLSHPLALEEIEVADPPFVSVACSTTPEALARCQNRLPEPEDILFYLGQSLHDPILKRKKYFFSRAIAAIGPHVNKKRSSEVAFRQYIFHSTATGKDLPTLNDTVFNDIKTMFYRVACDLQNQLTFQTLDEQYRFHAYCSKIQAWLDRTQSFSPPTYQMITLTLRGRALFLTPENRTLLQLACDHFDLPGYEVDRGMLHQFLASKEPMYVSSDELSPVEGRLVGSSAMPHGFPVDKLLVRFYNAADGLYDYSNLTYLFGLIRNYLPVFAAQQPVAMPHFGGIETEGVW